MTEPLSQVPGPLGRHVAADRALEDETDQPDAGNLIPPAAEPPLSDPLPADALHSSPLIRDGRHVRAQYLDDQSELAEPVDTSYSDAQSPVASYPAGQSPLAGGIAVAEAQESDRDEPRSTSRRPWPLGLIAAALTVVLIALQIVALSLTASGQFGAATVLGEILAIATVLPLVVGVLAIIRNRGRGLAVAAVLVAIVTNPLILIALLDFFSSF